MQGSCRTGACAREWHQRTRMRHELWTSSSAIWALCLPPPHLSCTTPVCYPSIFTTAPASYPRTAPSTSFLPHIRSLGLANTHLTAASASPIIDALGGRLATDAELAVRRAHEHQASISLQSFLKLTKHSGVLPFQRIQELVPDTRKLPTPGPEVSAPATAAAPAKGAKAAPPQPACEWRGMRVYVPRFDAQGDVRLAHILTPMAPPSFSSTAAGEDYAASLAPPQPIETRGALFRFPPVAG